MTPREVPATLQRHLPHQDVSLVADLARSRDAYLADARDGRRYLDFRGSGTPGSLGYNHPGLTDGQLLNRLGRSALVDPTPAPMATVDMAELLETFDRVARPEHLTRSLFFPSDERALEAALLLAFDWKARRNQRRGVGDAPEPQAASVRGAFHGRSGWGLALSDPALTDVPRAAPLPSWPRLTSPAARFPLEGASLRDTEDREIQSLAELRTAFRERPNRLAAVVIEPIQTAADSHFRPEFLQELRRACDELEALLIVDETRTGLGITGLTWAHQHLHVHPDVLVFGGRLPVAGVLVGDDDGEQLGLLDEPERLGPTWGRGLADVVLATRVLEILEGGELVQAAEETGRLLLSGLESLASENDRMTNVRGRGLLTAFDVPSAELRERLVASAREKGLLAARSGPRGVALRPPVAVKKPEVEHALSMLRDAFDATR